MLDRIFPPLGLKERGVALVIWSHGRARAMGGIRELSLFEVHFLLSPGCYVVGVTVGDCLGNS